MPAAALRTAVHVQGGTQLHPQQRMHKDMRARLVAILGESWIHVKRIDVLDAAERKRPQRVCRSTVMAASPRVLGHRLPATDTLRWQWQARDASPRHQGCQRGHSNPICSSAQSGQHLVEGCDCGDGAIPATHTRPPRPRFEFPHKTCLSLNVSQSSPYLDCCLASRHGINRGEQRLTAVGDIARAAYQGRAFVTEACIDCNNTKKRGAGERQKVVMARVAPGLHA